MKSPQPFAPFRSIARSGTVSPLESGRPRHEVKDPSPAGDVAVFCVASPLHYVAACLVADRFEAAARRVLVAYKPEVLQFVDAARWDAVVETPWPRMWPLPGPFGRHRRLLDNVDRVVRACEPGLRGGRVHLHAPVFDTEAVNYLLAALSRTGGAGEVRARILPDGMLNLARYPLSAARRLGQQIRRLRALVSPTLSYTAFVGDRTGSDAPFVDRIYVLAGFPYPYLAERVTVLPSLALALRAAADGRPAKPDQVRRALVIGQPLTGDRRMSVDDVETVAASIENWLARQGISEVRFKSHPRDLGDDLRQPPDGIDKVGASLSVKAGGAYDDDIIQNRPRR